MMVQYDCGQTYAVALTLGDNQSALHQPALVDTLVGLLDQQHDALCQVCRKEGDTK